LASFWGRALRRRQVILHVAEPGHFVAKLRPNDYGNGHGSSCRRAMPGVGTGAKMRVRTALRGAPPAYLAADEGSP
jgi:hypothetical protein